MNKIRIYHGSLEQVEAPEIRLPNRTLDYGCGFYTTTSYGNSGFCVKFLFSNQEFVI